MKKTVLVMAVAISLMSCNDASKTESTTTSSDSTTTFDLSAARKEIESDNAKFMEDVKKGDTNALAGHYHSEGRLMLSNGPSLANKDISSGWGSFARAGGRDLKLTTDDVDGDENFLIETGSYEMVGENNQTLDKGKYVVVWKKENGKWKIYRDIANSNNPPPSAK